MAFKENDRVKVSDSVWDIRDESGTVIALYDFDSGKAVVKLDSGRFVKVSVASLTKIEQTETKEPTITREQFREAAKKAIDPKQFTEDGEVGMSQVIMSMTGAVVVSRLERILFGEVSKDA